MSKKLSFSDFHFQIQNCYHKKFDLSRDNVARFQNKKNGVDSVSDKYKISNCSETEKKSLSSAADRKEKMGIQENSGFMITNISQSGRICDSYVEFPESRMTYAYDDLDFEEPNAAYYDPISFEEMASCLCRDVLQLDDFAVIKNRYSQSYLDLIRKLEKGISELASCAITKAVLEKKGLIFTKLDDLNLGMCRKIAVYHFRKCHNAIQNTTIKNQQFWLQMLGMEFQWYRLMLRLSATEGRITDIQNGKINIDNLIKKICRDNEPSHSDNQKRELSQKAAENAVNNKSKALPPSKGISFPIIGKFIRDEIPLPQKEEPLAIKKEIRTAASDFGLKAQASSDKNLIIAESDNNGKDILSEHKQFETMKKRKKAERLARKHAAGSGNAKSSTYDKKFCNDHESQMRSMNGMEVDEMGNDIHEQKFTSCRMNNTSVIESLSDKSEVTGGKKNKPPQII